MTQSPIGLILCADKSDEHVELLRLEESGIRVAQYLTELPPKELLEQKLHRAIELAQERLARTESAKLSVDAEILTELPRLDFAVKLLSERAFETHSRDTPQQILDAKELRWKVQARCKDLLDEWEKIAKELHDAGGALQYQTEAGSAQRLLYEFLNPELKTLPPRHKKFRANRSMRDVEPSVNLWLKTIDGVEIENEEENV